MKLDVDLRNTFIMVLFVLVSSYTISFNLIHQSKMLFLINKRLQYIEKGQSKILNNLPDGVLIYNHLEDNPI